LTAQALADRPEGSKRTVYRDIAIPIGGEAGAGCIMRPGYDLPPLNFDSQEITVPRVGLATLTRTGDSALGAALRIYRKVDALHGHARWL
jgi:predicted DNA-binding transcriptional regulator YafY